MQRSPRRPRLIEMILVVIGVSLIGAAFGETLNRWQYQQKQSRALDAGPATGSRGETGADIAQVLSTVEEPPVEEEHAAVPADDPIDAPPIDIAAEPSAHEPAPAPGKERPAPAVDPTLLGRIEIPRLGLRAVVRDGADDQTLAVAVGRVPESALPGEVGNLVLAGHRDSLFRPLRKIRVNDRIRLLVPPEVYEYEVRSLRVVDPEETSVLDSRGVEELTLVTCYPFRFVGPAPERFIVSATRVN